MYTVYEVTYIWHNNAANKGVKIGGYVNAFSPKEAIDRVQCTLCAEHEYSDFTAREVTDPYERVEARDTQYFIA